MFYTAPSGGSGPRGRVSCLSCRSFTLREDTCGGSAPPQVRFSGSFCDFHFFERGISPWKAAPKILEASLSCLIACSAPIARYSPRWQGASALSNRSYVSSSSKTAAGMGAAQ